MQRIVSVEGCMVCWTRTIVDVLPSFSRSETFYNALLSLAFRFSLAVMEVTCTLFRSKSSKSSSTTAGIFVLFILIVHVRVTTECLQCTGKSIKTINVTTGECISCFPCLRCEDGHTLSVQCGQTVPFGTEIKCVLIQSDHVSSTKTRYQASSSTKVVVAPITSISHPVVVSATSSSASVRPSITQNDESDTTKKPKGENVLPSEEWMKNTIVCVFIGICLAITLVFIVYKIIKWKRSKHTQLHVQPVNPRRSPTRSVQPSFDVTPPDNENCNIYLATETVTYTHDNYDQATGMRDGNQRSQRFISPAHLSSLDSTAALAVQPQITQLVPPRSCPQSLVNGARNGSVTVDGMQQGRPVNWSALSRREKYQEKVLNMPFSLLNKICVTLDILRPDGNDVRMLAEKFGISVSDLAFLKQAVITQNPDNVCCNSLSYVVLNKKAFLTTVGNFIDIMNNIERDDIVSLINNWH